MQIFDIQALLLVKAIAMFDLPPQALVPEDLNGIGFRADGNIGDQDGIAIFEIIVGHQNPQRLMSVG